MMYNILGNKMSLIEDKILDKWKKINKNYFRITVRDEVSIYLDGSKEYKLWSTPLVKQTCTGDAFINISSKHDQDHNYYYYGVRPRPTIITKTTKSRLDTFLNYYGFNSLEAHSSKKEWCVKYNGNELKTDHWYKLDFDTRNLIEVVDYGKIRNIGNGY